MKNDLLYCNKGHMYRLGLDTTVSNYYNQGYI